MNNSVLDTIIELETETIVDDQVVAVTSTTELSNKSEETENIINKIDNSDESVEITSQPPEPVEPVEPVEPSVIEHITNEMSNIKDQVVNTISENVEKNVDTITREVGNVVIETVNDAIETIMEDVINPIINETPEQRKSRIRRVFTFLSNGFKSLSNLMCAKCKKSSCCKSNSTTSNVVPDANIAVQADNSTQQPQQPQKSDVVTVKFDELSEFLKQNIGKVSEIRIIMNIS